LSLSFWQDNWVFGFVLLGGFFLILWLGLYRSGGGEE
jgi:hypothetical protein